MMHASADKASENTGMRHFDHFGSLISTVQLIYLDNGSQMQVRTGDDEEEDNCSTKDLGQQLAERHVDVLLEGRRRREFCDTVTRTTRLTRIHRFVLSSLVLS